MQILRITNGTETVNLINTGTSGGLHLAAQGWAPRVAASKSSELGNQASIMDVPEAIKVEPYGADGPRDLQLVTRMISDAARWTRDPTSPGPVLIQMRPDNSTLPSNQWYEAVIVGPADYPLELPSDYLDLLAIREITTTTITFQRRGAWYANVPQTAEIFGGVTPYTVRPLVFNGTVPLGTHHTPSPTSIGIGCPNVASYPNVSTSGPQHQPVGVLLVGSSADDFFVVPTSSIPTSQREPSASWAGVATQTAFAGQTTRFTWSAANRTGTLSVALAASAGVFDLYATLRIGNTANLANVVPWRVRARTPTNVPDASIGNWIAIERDQDSAGNDPAQHANARVVHLGQFERISTPTTFVIEVTAPQATAQDWIEFNIITSHRIRGIDSHAIAIDRAGPGLGVNTRNRSINIRTNARSNTVPSVRLDSGSALANAPIVGIPYRGDAYMETMANALSCVLMVTNARQAANAPTMFLPYSGANSLVYSVRGERLVAYLVPE